MHAATPTPAGADTNRLTLPDGVTAGTACDDTCITCGDVAVPVRVVELLPQAMAVVTTGAGLEQVSVALVAAEVGDVILVHAGEALAMLSDADVPDGGDPAPPPVRD